MNGDKLQSQAIDFLRFPMVVAVVVLHYSNSVYPAAEGPLRFLCILFQEGICRMAVPCFFFISGFLFFSQLEDGWRWDIWLNKLKKRVKSLLLPYLLWNIIAFFAYWGYARASGNSLSLSQAFHNNGGVRMFWSVSGGIPIGGSNAFPIDIPLWYVRDLMYYVLLTPLVYFFIKRTRFYGILALCVLHLSVDRLVPEGFIFFAAGACFRLTNKNIIETLSPGRTVYYFLALASITTLVLIQYHTDSSLWTKITKFSFLVFGIASSFCGAASLLDGGKFHVIPFLTGSSFFVFAAHEVLVLRNISTPVVNFFLPKGPLWECLAFFIVPSLAVTICLGIFFLMQKFLPRLTSVLTGNRKAAIAICA